MYDLTGKVALVTGTSRRRGIGCAIALRLAKEGADVVVNDKSIPYKDFDPWDREEGWRGLDSLVGEIEAMGRRALAVTADVSDSNAVNDMVARTVDKFGKIDILVNNAGLLMKALGRVHVVDLKRETWNNALGVNLTGTFLMSQAASRQMIKQGSGGKIINVSSCAGKRSNPGRAAYNATKAGIISFTQTLALELGQHKINVNAICPGMIVSWGMKGAALYEAVKRGLNEEQAIAEVYAGQRDPPLGPLGRPGKVADVANIVAFLASEQSDFITGQAINICGGELMAD